jgi:xylose isomerase
MKEIFSDIPRIAYEGPDSKNPLAFKYYNAKEKIGGKTMEEHLRFSMAFWHTINASGSDPFGEGTMVRPWSDVSDPMEKAKMKMQGLFELTTKLGIPFFCFHDRDIAPEGDSLADSNKKLDEIVRFTKELMKDHPTKLLWGTANLFNHSRYMHGAATSPNADVFAYAAAQVKKAIEVTQELGGENYVFWGGREGYETLLNTDMNTELDNLATFMHMAVEYAKEIGFTGQFLFEPKPKEPTKHQYDFDAAACYAFLKEYDLLPYVKLNIETNHATLAGHTVQHELHYARIHDILGSVDANQGDLLLGWDTDQFPTDLYVTTLMMYEILKNGGLHKGGLNFDAKPRRGSFETIDIAIVHIAGMDGFARGLKAAYGLLQDRALESFIDERYASYNSGIGAKIKSRTTNFKELERHALGLKEVKNMSGRQEYLETIVNAYL